MTLLFHKKGEKGLSGTGGRATAEGRAKKRHREQKQPSVRFLQGRPFTAEWWWHDLPGSKKALQTNIPKELWSLAT